MNLNTSLTVKDSNSYKIYQYDKIDYYDLEKNKQIRILYKDNWVYYRITNVCVNIGTVNTHIIVYVISPLEDSKKYITSKKLYSSPSYSKP